MHTARIVATVLLAFLAASAPAGPLAAAEPPGHLTAHFLDVGQGDATLVVSPTGKTVLVDGGGAGAAARVRAFLAERGVERLDLVVLTHPHADHLGGLVGVLEHVPVAAFIDPGLLHPSPAYDRLLELLERRRIPLHEARAGRGVDLGGGARLTFLGPPVPPLSGTRSDVNANGAVVRITHGEVSLLLAADAEPETEARLVAGGLGRSTVLKVAHHGGRYSTTPAFLSRVRPQVAVISVGRNGYGHPSPITLRRLQTVGARVLRTDRDGTVTVRTDGRSLELAAAGRPAGRREAAR